MRRTALIKSNNPHLAGGENISHFGDSAESKETGATESELEIG